LREANTVVITSRGKKYHHSDCQTVKGKTRTLTIAQALKIGYKPCGVCTPPAKPVTEAPNLDFEVYYFYLYGGENHAQSTRKHSDTFCSNHCAPSACDVSRK